MHFCDEIIGGATTNVTHNKSTEQGNPSSKTSSGYSAAQLLDFANFLFLKIMLSDPHKRNGLDFMSISIQLFVPREQIVKHTSTIKQLQHKTPVP